MNKTVNEIISNLILEMEATNSLVWDRQYFPMGISNYVTGSDYSILNTMILGMNAAFNSYDCPYWAGYKQIQSIGGQVKKGAKSCIITRVSSGYDRNEADIEDDEGAENKKKSKPVLKKYLIGCPVFNLEQTEGINWKVELNNNNSRIGTLDLLITDYKKRNPSLRIEEIFGEMAYYFTERDKISMPKLQQYKESEAFYYTLFHEIGHSTRHYKRLGYGDKYSNGWRTVNSGGVLRCKEEASVTIASMYILAKYGVKINYENNAIYIKDWLSWIKSSKNQFIGCLSFADKIFKYIMSGVEKENVDNEVVNIKVA